MQCEYFALEGLSALVDTIDALKRQLNPALEIEGILRTMFDVRNNLANAVSGELHQHFGDKVFRTIIPRNVRLAEAPSHGQSIVGYDRDLARRRRLPGPGRRDRAPRAQAGEGEPPDGDQEARPRPRPRSPAGHAATRARRRRRTTSAAKAAHAAGRNGSSPASTSRAPAWTRAR